jgi:hypothetical protein
MKNYQKGLLLLALVPGLGLTGCSDESPWSGSDDMGGIVLNLESDGRLMRHGTRADDTQCPIVPDANAFGIKLTKSDNTYSKTWSSLEGFNKESEFPIGDYTIEASYGDVTEQGFERPCFKGTNTLHVSPGTTTPVNVTATLANAMVTIKYTDAFLANYSTYSAAIETPSHSEPVLFPQGETRSAFIDPTGEGYTELVLTLTNDQGQTVNLRPAKFVAQPRRNYVITVNVTGNVSKGDAVLEIGFEEEVTKETITISLGDELFTSPAPEVRPTGFTVGTPVELMEYDELAVSPQFDLYAFGGFSEVNLKVTNTNGTYVPAFGSNVNLVNADATTQAQLADAGVKVSGLFRNPDKMAVVNVKNFLGNLPAGEYSVKVEVVDALGRLSTETVENPVELTATVTKTEYSIISAGNIDYLANEAQVVVNTNSQQLKNRIKFRVNNAEATVKSVTEVGAAPAPKRTRTRAELPYTYTYTLDVPQATTASVAVESSYGKLKATANVTVNGPAYEVVSDAFARFAVFGIETDNAEMKEYLTKNLTVYNGNAAVTPGNITRDVQNGFITVKGLSAGKAYEGYSLKLNDVFEKPVPSFTTEAETDVPNGNFSENGDHIYFNNINTGGAFGTLITYQWTTTIDRYAPAGWATLNAKTAYSGSNPMNTWFVEPSTYLDNGVCVVRTVGYHHNGTLPAKDTGNGGFKTYCGNAPGNLNISEGVLFLGSYNFDGTEHRENGMAFSSRPMSMTFDYKYSPLNGHQAQADLIVLDTNNDVIASQTAYLSACPDMQTRTIKIASYPFGKKASKLYVRFRSMRDDTEPALNIPSGSALSISGYNGATNNIPANEYKAFAVGSVLTLDNVKLGYADAATVTAAPRRNNKNK